MQTIKVKNSAVPGKRPTTLTLTGGELAVNTTDKKLFFGTGTDVVEVATSLDAVQNINLSSIASLPALPGLIRKLGDASYELDSTVYLSSINAGLVNAALGFTPYSTTNPAGYASKTYVDGLISGIVYKRPVLTLNLIGDAATPVVGPAAGDAYLISTGGNTGDWSTFLPDDIVQFNGTVWVKIGIAALGSRVGVSFTSSTVAVGIALGKDGNIGEITSGSSGSWAWAWAAPVVNDAVFSNNPLELLFGRSYVYSTPGVWIEFAGPGVIVDGAGLSYSGNTLNVNAGAGVDVINDAVVAKLHMGGGLMTTLDGTTSSGSTAASLSLSKIGTPGTYKSVVTDGYGRVTGGTNPTTLSGFGITDALATSQLGAVNGVASLDLNGQVFATELPTFTGDVTAVGGSNVLTLANVVAPGTGTKVAYNAKGLVTGNSALIASDIPSLDWSKITSGFPTTREGYGITDAQPLDTDLTALSGLLTTGLLVRSGSGAAVTRAITGTPNQVSISNGDGVTSDPVVSLPTGIIFPGNTPLTIPSGTTIQRNLIMAVNGMFWYNTTLAQFEFYQNEVWTPYNTPVPQGTGTVSQTLTGNILPATGNSVIPYTTALPLSTAGTQIWAKAITPKATTSRIGISFPITVDASSNNRTIVVSLFRGNSCIATMGNEIDTGAHPKNMTMLFVDNPATITTLTYSARIGIDVSTANWYVNSTVSGNNLGGSLSSNYRLDEIA